MKRLEPDFFGRQATVVAPLLLNKVLAVGECAGRIATAPQGTQGFGYDPVFWGNQDFLKPEDNLLQELKNMKVRLQEFSEF